MFDCTRGFLLISFFSTRQKRGIHEPRITSKLQKLTEPLKRPMTTKTKLSWIGLLCLLVAFPLLPSTAQAAAKKEKKSEIGSLRREGIDVVQRRVFRKSLRHEFSLGGAINADNQFLLYEYLDARYTFHFREALSFEAHYARAFSQNKAIVNDLANIPCPPGVPSGTSCAVTLNPPPDPTKNMYFGNLVWSPIYGKFSIFSKKIYHFDVYLVAGAGMFDNERSNRFAFNVGIGTKIYVNNWFAVRFDLRNITVKEGAPFNHIINNRTMAVGVSFFLPTKPYD